MENRLAPLVENNHWFTLSRFGGCMRFHWIRKGKTALWLALLMLAVRVMEIALAMFDVADCRLTHQQPDLPFALAMVYVLALSTAKKDTTFLCRFGTPRTSIWLSNVLSLLLFGVCYLLLSVAVNAVAGAATVALDPECAGITLATHYQGMNTGAFLLQMLKDTWEVLPRYLLYLAEYTCLFYLLACCLRRWKAATIIVLVGVPALLITLIVLPTVQTVAEALESNDQGVLMSMFFKLIGWLEKAADFTVENWQWIQGGAALVSLLLSYLVMRGTRQPE